MTRLMPRLRSDHRSHLLMNLAWPCLLLAVMGCDPNRLEADTRAKVERAKAEQRRLGQALESYMADTRNAVPLPRDAATSTAQMTGQTTSTLQNETMFTSPTTQADLEQIRRTYDPSNGTTSESGVFPWKQ